MTVTTFITIQPRPWRGSDDPGLPAASFLAQGFAIGDASGGVNQVVFRFNLLTSAASARFYNLEQIETHHTVSTSTSVAMFTLNFDQVGNTTLQARHWGWGIESNGNSRATINYTRFPPLPLFLGQATRLGSQQTSLTIQVPNTDTITFVATIQGYVWDPRSVQAPGGLRRPVETIFGQ